MTPSTLLSRHPSAPALLLSAATLALLVLSMPASAQFDPRGGRAVPSQGYFLAMTPYYQGDYRDAAKGFRAAASSGVNTGQGRWVDSICYYTMIGECLYRVGDLPGALKQYDAALELMIARQGWLARIQFPPAVQPNPRAGRLAWGPKARNTVPGLFPDTMLSMQGTDLDRTLRVGGTVAAPELYPVRVIEILRCVGLAIKRRRELLGPIAPHTALTAQVVRALSKRQVAPNHWSQAMINVQLGLARAAAGDTQEALTLLQQSLSVGGRLDHPLTSLALLEIGDLALEQSDLDLAQRSYLEATFPAVYFDQPDVLDEALRGAARIHSIKGESGVFGPLSAIAQYAQSDNWDRAATAAMLASVENLTLTGDAQSAKGVANQARRAMGRSDLPVSDLGAWASYLNALSAYGSDNRKAGDKALQDCFRLLRRHSPRQFQIELTSQLFSSKEISSRVAGGLYAELLREPRDSDWQVRPAETIMTEVTSHLKALERWLGIAIETGQVDLILLVSEQIRRHKFFLQQPLGGRLLAMRWILEAPDPVLDDVTRSQRQLLLTRSVDWTKLSQRSRALETRLAGLPVAPTTGSDVSSYLKATKEIMRIAEQQEQRLWRLALRPDPTARIFPPLLTLDDLQSRLAPGQAILVLIAAGRTTHALLVTTNRQYRHWQLKTRQPATAMASLMREIGNFDANQVLPAERLTRDDWKRFAAALYAPLAGELSVTALEGIDELVIVPDGIYWYLPFEMLPVGNEEHAKTLIEMTQVRYAPTASLAVADGRPAMTGGQRVIVHGRLFSRETEAILQSAVERLTHQHPRSAVLRRRLPVTTRFVAPGWQQLIVLDDIETKGSGATGWSPAQIDGKKPGGSLQDWLLLPWGAPDTVVLPGFRTVAENGMRGTKNGDELLLATCTLMGAGTRNLLISRWRTGGQMSMEVAIEFMEGLDSQTPAAAWQRSVLLARSTELDPSAEPRVKEVDADTIPTGDHPFFWAGYMVMGPGSR